MADFYAQLKFVHVWAVILSGSLFSLRGMLMMARSRHTNHPALRRLSVVIDTVLLAAALALATIVHQYPFVHAWLTVKLLLLIVYIVLGTIALKRGRSRAIRTGSLFAALAVYLFIVGVARTRDPWGVLGTLP